MIHSTTPRKGWTLFHRQWDKAGHIVASWYRPATAEAVSTEKTATTYGRSRGVAIAQGSLL